MTQNFILIKSNFVDMNQAEWYGTGIPNFLTCINPLYSGGFPHTHWHNKYGTVQMCN